MATSSERIILKKIERKLRAGILAAVQGGAEGYLEKVTAEQSPPTSDPGEYPHEDTGQGAANIGYDLKGLEGRFGLKGDNSDVPVFEGQDHRGGEHLDELRKKYGRLGMDTSFAEDLNAIRRFAKKAIEGRE